MSVHISFKQVSGLAISSFANGALTASSKVKPMQTFIVERILSTKELSIFQLNVPCMSMASSLLGLPLYYFHYHNDFYGGTITTTLASFWIAKISKLAGEIRTPSPVNIIALVTKPHLQSLLPQQGCSLKMRGIWLPGKLLCSGGGNRFPELFITICQGSLQMAETLQKCRVGLSSLSRLLSTLIYGSAFPSCLDSLRCRISL